MARNKLQKETSIWVIGSFVFHAVGGMVHLLLAVALVSAVLHFGRGSGGRSRVWLSSLACSIEAALTQTPQETAHERHSVSKTATSDGEGGIRQGPPGVADKAGGPLGGTDPGAGSPRGDRGRLPVRALGTRGGREGRKARGMAARTPI